MRRIFLTCALAASSWHEVAAVDRPGAPVDAVPAAADIIAQSNGIKIYRALSQHGTPVVVLTNLDPDGARLINESDDPSTAGMSRSPEGAGGPDVSNSCGNRAGEAAVEPPAPEPATSVRVVVNRGEGAADETGVEVTGAPAGGTTVVININPPPPDGDGGASPAPPIYPVLAIGGLPGPYHYPDRLPFLGYGTGVTSPSWFGGLGLNAGNGFGLRTGVSCGRGYDCMFGPATSP